MSVSNAQLERLVVLLSLGISVAIRGGKMTTEEAGHFLFSPYTMKLLRMRGAQEGVVDLIHSATELEDVESMLPSEMQASLDDLLEEALACLDTGEPYDFNADKWLSKVVA